VKVMEIFTSFQGEGTLVGVPQVMVRLRGCNLRCSYCDTPQAREEEGPCLVRRREGEAERHENPLHPGEAAELVSSLWRDFFHSVSLTGGEPLLQAGELASFLPMLKERGMPVYLETNGTLPRELARVVEWVDWIAMDLKLPGTQQGQDLLRTHLDFLEVARGRRVILKMVVWEGVSEEEVERFCRAAARAAGDSPLVLQPLSPAFGERAPGEEGAPLRGMADAGPTAGRGGPAEATWLMGLCRVAGAYFPSLRVIPQVHRLWGIR